jgi:N-acetylmuramic acid 6-phosphate etherase
VSILEKLAGLDRRAARRLLAAAGARVPVALVMAKAGVERAQAATILRKSRGQVRSAIKVARTIRGIAGESEDFQQSRNHS